MSRKLTLDLIFSEMNIKNISGLIALNIKGKNINDISILSQIPSLEIVSLNNNDINNLVVFKNLKNLKKLSLKGNKINDFNQIENLRYCSKLEYLKLKDNPISLEKNYFSSIVGLLPNLKILDDININKFNNVNNKENSNDKSATKNIDVINNESKFIKLKATKIRNNFNTFNPNLILGSPKKQPNQKINNNNVNYQIGKKSSKEKIIQKIDKKENNNNFDKDNKNVEKEKSNNNVEDDDDFEIININDEKKKMEKENKKYQKIEPKPKAEILNYSFKKKSSTGYFFYDPKKKNQKKRTESNIGLDNNSNNDFFNSMNDEHKMIYNYSTSKYSRKIIGRIHGNNALSQSIRYDDEDEDNKKNGIYSRKSKLGALKNRLLNNIANKIYNKSKKNSINEMELEKEKIIVKSIKLLLTNLDEEELNQINSYLKKIIEKNSKE